MAGSGNGANQAGVDTLIRRLHAQNIDIEATQAQFLLEATHGDVDLALTLYWEDSVAQASRERDNAQNNNNNGNGNDGEQNANQASRKKRDDRVRRDTSRESRGRSTLRSNSSVERFHELRSNPSAERSRERQSHFYKASAEEYDTRRDSKAAAANENAGNDGNPNNEGARHASRQDRINNGGTGSSSGSASSSSLANHHGENFENVHQMIENRLLRRNQHANNPNRGNSNRRESQQIELHRRIQERMDRNDHRVRQRRQLQQQAMDLDADLAEYAEVEHPPPPQPQPQPEANANANQQPAPDPDLAWNNNNRAGGNHHVSVSDDENAFNERFLKRIKNHMKKRKGTRDSMLKRKGKRRKIGDAKVSWAQDLGILKRSTHVNKAIEFDLREMLKQSKRLKSRESLKSEADTDDDDDDDDDDYLSDVGKGNSDSINDDGDDYDSILEDAEIDAQYGEALNLFNSGFIFPSQLLWGSQGTFSPRPDAQSDDDSDTSDAPSAGDLPVPKRRRRTSQRIEDSSSGEGDGGDDGGDNSDGEPPKGESKRSDVQIPRTWLSAGFTLSSCGVGLCLSEPDDTELARLKSIQSTLYPPGMTGTPPPLPPFHCRGVTMLTSLVTALIYSGVSIQGKEINCNSCARKPFGELKAVEKAREFPQRLSDALSAILFMAADRSTKHRLRTIAEISKKIDESNNSLREGYESDEDDLKDDSMRDREATMKRVVETRAKLCPVCRWDQSDTNKDEDPLDRENLRMEVSLTNRSDLKSYVVANLRAFMAPGGCALFMETILHIHGLPQVKRMICQMRGVEHKDGQPMAPLIQCNCDKQLKEDCAEFVKLRKLKPSLKQKDVGRAPCRDCIRMETLSMLLCGKPHAGMNGWTAEKFGVGFLSGDIVENKMTVCDELKSPPQPIWIVRGGESFFTMWSDEKMSAKSLPNGSYSFEVNTWSSWNGVLKKHRVIPCRAPGNFSSVAISAAKSGVIEEEESKIDTTITAKDITKAKIHPDDELIYDDYKRCRWHFGEKEISAEGVATIKDWIPYFKLDERRKEIVLRKRASSELLAIWTKWPKAIVETTTMTKGAK